jgi:hypothetical protein
MRAIWERCGAVQGSNDLTAMNEALVAAGSTLQAAYQEYAVWGQDTASYADGANYPRAWIDATATGSASFSSDTSPSLTGMGEAGYAVQMHLSTVYLQVVSPAGSYEFTSSGGVPALNVLVEMADGSLTDDPVALSAGAGSWTAPAGAVRAVAVVSNVSATADGMSWSLTGGSGGSARDGDGGGSLDLGLLALGLAGLARRAGRGTRTRARCAAKESA